MRIDRRSFLLGSAAVAAEVACARVPGPARRHFLHGVASGDPLADRVVLWTRVTPPPAARGPLEVRWSVGPDPDLSRPTAGGRALATPERDFTVKVDAAGLEPGRSWYYRFEALGEISPLGRTRTLPVGSPERLRLAVCSCANIAFGWFNVYALIARRPDLDAVVHLGDYLYEYANGEYGDGARWGRAPEPDREIVSLSDYRTRHAQYKRDPDLQEAHRLHPFVCVWDDHESANNAWRDGAQNHQAGEGAWSERRAAAERAYAEWMPIRERERGIYRAFRFGDLADVVMLDTRLVGRDRPVDDAADVERLADPRRSMLGPRQEGWLLERLSASHRDGVAWRILGQQTMFGQLRIESGAIRNPDAWDGYPETRRRILERLVAERIPDNVVLTGDYHTAWALDLAPDPYAAGYEPATGTGAVGVEFVVPGVTSPGFTDPTRAAEAERRVLAANPHIRWVDFSHRGYALLSVDREAARAEWYFPDTVEERSLREFRGAAVHARRGDSHVVVEDPGTGSGA